ncbi:hypothetical protein F2Q70_00002707 [Brassica cretica]|uniref:Uncharacterized protein n=1 Tax=Brassica cretica TaxID=69181 RepID=A0A8S9IWD4_BRACR|nr:hypothetical protein F2Q70_00002707 [Brassica cretica]
MSDTHYHGEEISAETYATLRRHQFNLESLEERLQRMENTTATVKEKWRRWDEAMRGFTGAFWRYLEQAPEMTIELDHLSILEMNNRSILTSVYRSTAKRAESPFGHIRLEAQVFTILKDYP